MSQQTPQCTEDELVSLYLETAWGDVRELEALLRRLGERPEDRPEDRPENRPEDWPEDTPEDWPECRVRLRELAHNVKGQGAAFGYQLMTRIGESLSVLLKAAETCDAHRLKLIGAHAAALRTVLERDIAGSGGALGDTLVDRLGALVREAG